MRSRTRPCRPTAEALEVRAPLAGDLTISLIEGNLQIVGDSAPNAIVVEQVAAGTFTIRGESGERLRPPGGGFTTGPVTIQGVTGGLLVSLGAGDDALTVRGRGLDRPCVGFLTVLAGSGADRVQIEQVRTGGAEFPNRPTVLPELRRQSAAIGRIADENARSAGSLTIDTGAGDRAADGDTLSLDRVRVLGSTVLQTGQGADRIELEGLDARGVRVFSDAGDDQVVIAAQQAVAAFAVDLALADGDDRVLLGPARLRLTAHQTSTFDGGRGRNILRGVTNLAPGSIGTLADPRRTGFQVVS